jgi:hypothetical protein
MTRGSAKVKAYRARQRAGLVVLKVPVLEFETLQALLEAGLLTVGEALDRRRVEHAVGRVVVDWARQWQAINSDRLAPRSSTAMGGSSYAASILYRQSSPTASRRYCVALAD